MFIFLLILLERRRREAIRETETASLTGFYVCRLTRTEVFFVVLLMILVHFTTIECTLLQDEHRRHNKRGLV